MEFFVENWLWFLVAGIVILMTLIGYIAEKTDFGRKDITKTEKKSKASKKENKESTDVLEVEESKPEVQMSLATDSIFEEPVTQNLENTGMDDFEQPVSTVEEVILENPTEKLNETFMTTTQEIPVREATLEELSVPFGNAVFEEPVSAVEEIVDEEPVEELTLEDVTTPNMALPDLDSIITEEDDSDDLWKF